MTIVQFPIKGTTPPSEPPVDVAERLVKLETLLPALATKADVSELRTEMHRSISEQTWRIVTFVTSLFVTIAGGLVAATYFIAKHVP